MQGWNQSVRAKGNKQSIAINVTVGVPQGGPLSSKLFTYDTDDINNDALQINKVKGDIAKFSDDTRFLHEVNKSSFASDLDGYECGIHQIASISKTKNLKLNASKSQIICFQNKGIKNPEMEHKLSKPIELDGNIVPNVNEVKYLGLIIDKSFSWNSHITMVVKKVNYIIRSLTSIIPFMKHTTRIVIFKSYIAQNMLYASEVWMSALSEKNRKKLRRPVKYFSRISSVPIKDLLSIINLQYKQRFTKSVYKIMNNRNNQLHRKLEQCTEKRHTRRPAANIFARTKVYQTSFIPPAARFFNRWINTAVSIMYASTCVIILYPFLNCIYAICFPI